MTQPNPSTLSAVEASYRRERIADDFRRETAPWRRRRVASQTDDMPAARESTHERRAREQSQVISAHPVEIRQHAAAQPRGNQPFRVVAHRLRWHQRRRDVST